MSFVNSLVAFNIVLGALLGIGIKAGFLLPVQTATANWFIRKRSLALALIMTASVLGEALITFWGEQVTTLLEWRAAFTWLGAGILVIGIPLAFVIRHRPEQYGYLPDGNTAVSDEDSESGTGAPHHTIEVNFTLRQALKINGGRLGVFEYDEAVWASREFRSLTDLSVPGIVIFKDGKPNLGETISTSTRVYHSGRFIVLYFDEDEGALNALKETLGRALPRK